MSRRWLLSLLCLAVPLLLFVQLTRARGVVRVNEAKTRVLLQKEPAEVRLAIENLSDENLNVGVQVEVLDPRNHVLASNKRDEAIARGSQTLALSVPLYVSKLAPKDRSELLWYRLHYRLTHEQSSTDTIADGIVSLSEITPELFELRVATSDIAREGGRYRARVQAVHPITQQPAGDVLVDAEVTLEDDDDRDVTLRASGITDSTGYVVLDFRLPPRFPQFPHTVQPAGGEIHVTARRGSLVAEASADVLVDQFQKILISTDKPLYQPGQTLHVRALALSPTRHALADQNVILKISDPEQTDVFRASVKTSRFGIASTDWPIPENTRLGDYRIKVSFDEEESGEITYDVRVSRYDLPNFSVSVQPNARYYLPGQNAEVKVRADYLFGKPVTRGHVRVVRETEREWDYQEQKWNIEEGGKYEGDTNADGIFVAGINLADDYAELVDEEYRRFKDVSYAAYFTDPTTNRTEQRRFDLRVSREAIHVYIIRSDYDYAQNRRLPLRFYVSTSYADGSPAQCKADVFLNKTADSPGKQRNKLVNHLLTTLRTNHYGLAKLSGLRLPRAFEDEGEIDLVVSADDLRGRVGSKTESLSIDDDDTVLVETDKTLYGAGEPISALVTSSVADLHVIVDLARESTVIRSERIKLDNSRGSITFPYGPEFKDKLTIAAYADFPASRRMIGTRSVLYPRNRDLKVDLRPTQTSYRPGEDASVSLRVRAPEGQAAESALGVVVFDKAVEERSRTDLEFGTRASGFYGAFRDLFGSNEQLAGVTLQDLQRLNMLKPVPPDLDLAAEVLLNQSEDYFPNFFGSESSETDQAKVFAESIKLQLTPLKEALALRYARTAEYPHDESTLRLLLRDSGIDLDTLRDPWGVPYRPVVSVDKQDDVLTLTTAGADKRFETRDDFAFERMSWPYFRPVGEIIDRALRQHHERSVGFIRDFATLRDEVLKTSFDLASMRDRWARPYRFDFEVNESQYVLKVRSGGPDRKLAAASSYLDDDFIIWTSAIDYFAESRAQIGTVLTQQLKSTNHFPETEPELSTALRNSTVALEPLHDPWGHAYYATFKRLSFFADRVRIEDRAQYGESPKQRMEITPVTQQVMLLSLRSPGADGKPGTPDDFDVATFAEPLSEQRAADSKPRVSTAGVILSETSGAITGVVTDPNGAVISRVRITATRSSDSRSYSTSSSDEGQYGFTDLPPGSYVVQFSAPGFSRTVFTNVLVSPLSITELNATLRPGAVSESVMVTSSRPDVQTTSMESSQVSSLPINGKRYSRLINVITKSGTSAQLETPRLREYFPETLVWQPSLETDKQGRAQLKFKLADNITTWKMSVIGSTEDGEIGTAETEIRAFQPFFVEHDPPRVLTEGDQISLPIVLRNYLERAQTVDLEIKPESWFTLQGSARQRANVPAGDAARQTFELKAVASVKDGKQRVTARSSEASDAIEKPVTVHPDGEDKTQTASDVLGDAATLDMTLPASVIPGSTQAELKIYPNLMAHVVESIEGILERPHGCGEQTISSTYPSLLVLRRNKQTKTNSQIATKAQRYAGLGYQRLLNYRTEDGGFSYWGRGQADLALTAYALRFLHDAAEFVTVDDEVAKGAREWLIKQQRVDGSWVAYDYYPGDTENQRRTALLTAFVARVLAMTERSAKPDGTVAAKQQSVNTVSRELQRALSYLSTKIEAIDEPYLIASYALAAIEAGDKQGAMRAAAKLRTLAHTEGDTTYWALETNTPFYGWGLAGRVETTALAIQALVRSAKTQSEQAAKSLPSTDPLVRSGLLFLLRQKDRYGVWYSTQATINVLDTLMTLLATDAAAPDRKSVGTAAPVEIIINGQLATSVNLPSGDQTAGLIRADISRFLQNGTNRIELRRAAGSGYASVQWVANYYVPWSASSATQNSGVNIEASSSLRLAATFDKTAAKVNEEIVCHVKAERVGFHGYGMMLAEIGLPPGADVDRASLESAMKNSGWAISQYDVLPDRVVIYLWTHAGGVDFNFKFRPRFALTAKTAPSVVYDYYNPEARAVVEPATFVVR